MPERLLDLARAHLGAEIAVLSDIAGGEQVVRAVSGSCAFEPGTVLRDSLCLRAAQGLLPGVITDTRRNWATRDLKVTHKYGIGSYVGVPWRAADGSRGGMLCCLSRTPNPRLGEESARFLALLAEMIGDELDVPASSSEREDARLLRDVLRDRALRMVFQPVVRLRDGKMVGAEALARFDLSAFPTPAHAFSAADRSGLGIELELLAVERAFEALPDMPPDTTLGVNLSAEALLDPAVQKVVIAHGPDNILVEITEHTRVSDYTELNEAIALIRDAGVLIAVDDAGAGFASLRHILALRPDIIKLDISLTRDVDTDPVRGALARSLVSFASEVGARLVAEGVETRAEHDRLRSIGVDFGQGYFLARPGPLAP